MTFPEDENPLDRGQKPYQQPNSGHLKDKDDGLLPGDKPAYVRSTQDTESEFDFARMEEDVDAFRRELGNLHLSTTDPNNEEASTSAVPPTARRRRRTPRIGLRPDTGELNERLGSIIQRSAPTFDFFVFSFLCGCILGVGYLLDAPAILIIGILIAPLLAPWVGTALSVASGEVRLFWQTFGGMATALFMVFIVGLLAGLASRIFQPLNSSQAFYHSRLWWPDLLMLIIGAVLLVFAFIQSDEKPMIASLMVTYQIYLPVSAAGFGLGSGIEGLWPQAGLVFLVHLSLALIVSLIVFFYMGFRPLEFSGYVLATIAILAGLVILAGFAGMGSLINVRGEQSSATPQAQVSLTPKTIPASLPSPRPSLTASATIEAAIPSATVLPITNTLPAITATNTTLEPTLLPTPVYGRIQSKSGGVLVRVKPGGATITTVLNGYLAEILNDKPIVLSGATWVHVIIKTPTGDIDGWVLLELILTATPSGSP